MKLTALEAEFLRYAPKALHPVAKLSDAQGIIFLCPKCYAANSGPVGTHMVLAWFADRGVPAEEKPLPRWRVSGSGLHDLTLAPSIYLIDPKLPADQQRGCQWHGFVRNGDAT